MSLRGENWTCPHCNRPQVVANERYHAEWRSIDIHQCEAGELAYYVRAIVCANAACRKLSLEFALGNRKDRHGDFEITNVIKEWRMLPASFAKPQPDCVPQVLRTVYYEACAIRDLSPTASATLARRCIQGMIRDFCGITKARLVDEIGELRKQVNEGRAPVGVQPDTVDAIDHVRSIGNIGAHMEADINVIVDVDPGEAQKLIELIELLFDEWYVARDTRTKRLAELGVIAATKKAAKHQGAVPSPPKAAPTPKKGT